MMLIYILSYRRIHNLSGENSSTLRRVSCFVVLSGTQYGAFLCNFFPSSEKQLCEMCTSVQSVGVSNHGKFGTSFIFFLATVEHDCFRGREN